VRKAESRFMAFRLKDTLQKSSHWGAVWITTTETNAADVVVKGHIVTSDGEQLVLGIDVVDVSGRVWLRRTYKAEADENAAYPGNGENAYQDLYNTVANDMLAVLSRLERQQLSGIRTIAQLKFASALAPDAFNDYLREDKDGALAINRLPARDDPMIGRVLEVREREYMLLDTLNVHYTKFYKAMERPYEDWQQYTREEAIEYRRLKRSGLLRKLLGALAIVGGVIYDAKVGGRGSATMSELMILGGIGAFKSGMDKDAEAQFHTDSIRELSTSLESEVAPLGVEVEGRAMELTGSAEQQYEEWRRLLREIYISETGFALREDTAPAGEE